MKRVAVVGAGAWGTALAEIAARAGIAATLWARDPALCDGPALAGPAFDTSRTEGQISLAANVRCSFCQATMLKSDMSPPTMIVRRTMVTSNSTVVFPNEIGAKVRATTTVD